VDKQSENGSGTTGPVITIGFTPDGQMELHAEGGVGPPQLWAAAKLLETWGDSEFASQMLAAKEHGSKLAIPGQGPRSLRRIGS
jgi:hypothetical protein